jgi:hypothetical protein
LSSGLRLIVLLWLRPWQGGRDDRRPEGLPQANPFGNHFPGEKQRPKNCISTNDKELDVTENRGRFLPGNQAARTHGDRSRKTVTETVLKRLATEALAEYPALEYQPRLLERLITARRHIEELRAYLDKHGTLDERGHPRLALDKLHQRERAEADCIKLMQSQTRSAALPHGIAPWVLGQYRIRMELAEDSADLERLAKRRLGLISQGVPPALLPETPEDAHRVGVAQRAAYAALKEEVGHARALELAKKGEAVDLFVGSKA